MGMVKKMKINSIVIVGGGSAGWMTAATLIKTFPNKKISIIESPNYPTVGVGESTIGGIKRWTKYIGLNESSFFPCTDASLKLSIKFTDFYKKDFGSFHYPFGSPFSLEGRNPYADWHIKKYFEPDTQLDDFVRYIFPSAALFENNKFNINLNNEFDNFDADNDIAYHFDATKFANWLRDHYCIPAGVELHKTTVNKILTDQQGIKHLCLDNGETMSGDLYIDCTGFESLLLGKTLDEPFDSYSSMLPNNKAWATRISYKDRSKELEGFTNCTAIENGWCWNIPLWSRLGAGYVYSDKFISKEQALEEFKTYLMSNKMVVPRTREEVDGLEFKELTMRVGIHKRTFVKNVVAIGLSAGFIEPLESNGLYSVHEFLFKLIDILQRGSINQFDRDMYNVSVRDQFDNFAKFVSLHYALSHRDDSDYWKSIQEREFSDSLGDPYFPYKGRADSYYNLTWRFMEEWGHPLDKAGIPFISTGMNLLMMNETRIKSIESRFKVDMYELYKDFDKKYKVQSQKWKQAAEKSSTLEEYLQKVYYTNNNNNYFT